MQVEPEYRSTPAGGRPSRRKRRAVQSPPEASLAGMPHRDAPQGITGTVEIAFCGDPSISRSLTAR